MNIFKRLKSQKTTTLEPQTDKTNKMALAEMVIQSIGDGVIIVDQQNVIKMLNPAAITMTGCGTAEQVMGLDLSTILKFENGEGMSIEAADNKILAAIREAKPIQTREYILVTMQNQKRPVAITVALGSGGHNERVVIFRDISKELEEEGAQTEFVSTASHEMRTPVASIEGYLGLALNPQTATIDERARKYLEEAHNSSQHLGRLFQDLLDVTKLDDRKIKVRLAPVEVTELVKSITEGQMQAIQKKNLQFSFGSDGADNGGDRRVGQLVYALVDIDFLREIVNNLLENAIKYTESGGAIWVNVRGEDDRVLVNITDTGIGISPDDLTHIFQKFYRVDNSQTRTIGGTGLGLYLVKQRAEAMGGKVWAESSFGEGSTFYVSFPRLTQEEYERRKQIIVNQNAMSPKAGSAPIGNPPDFSNSAIASSNSLLADSQPIQNQTIEKKS